MSYEDFYAICNGIKIESKYDMEKKLFNKLGDRYVQTYLHEIKELKEMDTENRIREWWLRTHLIIDHISGMTDDYALASYQMLTGIKVYNQ